MELLKIDGDGYEEGHYKFNPDTADSYVSCGALSVGDYGGSGSVGEANVRVLEAEDRDDVLVRHGGHGYRQAWLLDTPENRELVEGLERDYPLLDEEEHSKVEMDWEEEAWKGWLCSELLHTMGGSRPALRCLAEDVDEGVGGVLWDCYRSAMEETNTYPTPEYSGVHVDTRRIQDSFEGFLFDHVRGLVHYAAARCGAENQYQWEHDRTDRLVLADLLCEKWADVRAEAVATYLRDSVEEVGLERAEAGTEG